MSWNGKKEWTKRDWTIWALTVWAILMLTIALLSAELRADELPEPLPTQMSTSWGATPTVAPMRPYYGIVYLPLIGGE